MRYLFAHIRVEQGGCVSEIRSIAFSHLAKNAPHDFA
jgi:hypothetical protein